MQALGDQATSDANASAASAVESAASAVESADSADSAAASANHKGEWSNLAAALNIPASVGHNSNTWVLQVNLADVTLSEPTEGNSDWIKTSVDLSWGAPQTASDTLAPQKEQLVDVTGGNVTKTLPTPLIVGDFYTVGCFDSVSATSGNICTIARNGHTIYRPDGVTVVDPTGDGNLDLEIGDAVKLVAMSTTEIKVV
jgi:hypothetical protein